jgi:hypothetical protein
LFSLSTTGGSCISQDDRYDAAGNYLKTLCTYNAKVTRDAAALACRSIGMQLADPENHPESWGVLLTRAEGEFAHALESVWTDGKNNGNCSLIKFVSQYKSIRAYVPCSEPYRAYCEFNSECNLVC